MEEYSEVRYYRRGSYALGCGLIGAVLLLGSLVFGAAAAGVLGVLMMTPLLLKFETIVDDSAVTLRVLPVWRKKILLKDIARAEVVVADNQVEIFGGWNAREDVVTALVAGIEGDRSVGNRAVRIHLRGGGFHQVGTFRPQSLQAAINDRIR